ncbi:Mth938-like domain-containing protein [Hydrogenophaga sp.]|uniref:Mth938-like domain-containing protein n=1 Tax=Hydrogenophaga sp. TaxID=1904254 RepID=UPI0019BFB6E8|nr:Mth938-like domain-containing protein [Hydrogenophaga sp.]MBD3892511.1 hypothetical protein [Hydrogenophaga sp.]
MKLHADKTTLQSITAYGENWIAVDGERHAHSLVLSWSGQRRPWSCQRFDTLQPTDFEQLLEHLPQAPELLLFGSGTRLRFAHPALLQNLLQQRIGVETMDTRAACRTYNILAAEGRRVVAALLLES